MGLTESFDNDWRVCDSCQNSPSRDSHAALSSSAVEHLHLQWSLVRLIPFTLGSGNSTPQGIYYFSLKRTFLKGLISLLIYGVPFWALRPSRRSSYPKKLYPLLLTTHISALCWADLITNVQQMSWKKYESIKALRK